MIRKNLIALAMLGLVVQKCNGLKVWCQLMMDLVSEGSRFCRKHSTILNIHWFN